jgi:hypothetical protein
MKCSIRIFDPNYQAKRDVTKHKNNKNKKEVKV